MVGGGHCRPICTILGEGYVGARSLRRSALTDGLLATDLRVLHLDEVTLQFEKPSRGDGVFYWFLPQLHTLFSRNTWIVPPNDHLAAGEQLFTPIVLPSLTKIAYCWAPDMVEPAFEPLGGQLTHVLLRRLTSSRSEEPSEGPRWARIPTTLLRYLTSLQHLSLDLVYVNDVVAVGALPSAITSLHLHCIKNVMRGHEEELVNYKVPKSLLELQTLFIGSLLPRDVHSAEGGEAQEPQWRHNTREWIHPAKVEELDLSHTDEEQAWERWIDRVSRL